MVSDLKWCCGFGWDTIWAVVLACSLSPLSQLAYLAGLLSLLPFLSGYSQFINIGSGILMVGPRFTTEPCSCSLRLLDLNRNEQKRVVAPSTNEQIAGNSVLRCVDSAGKQTSMP